MIVFSSILVKLGDIVAQIKSAVEQILKYAADSGSKYVTLNLSLYLYIRFIRILVKNKFQLYLNNAYRRICIAGHSAGAHLAATLLHDDDWINRMTQEGYFALLKEIVLIGGIYNIKPLVDTSFGIALQLTE